MFISRVKLKKCDSNNAIFLGDNLTFHVKREHIDIKYHFVMNIVEDGNVIKTGEHKKIK